MGKDLREYYRALKEERKEHRTKMPVCPQCYLRNPGGATKMHEIEGGYRCHYCKYTETKRGKGENE